MPSLPKLKISFSSYELVISRKFKNIAYFGHADCFNNIVGYGEKLRYDGIPVSFSISPEYSNLRMYMGSPAADAGFLDHQYKIRILDWETTRLPNEFRNPLLECNEVWVHNNFVKNVVVDAGIDESKIHIYGHGVHKDLSIPKMRGKNNKIRFLQIDAGGSRKNAEITKEAFSRAFNGNPNYELTLKYSDVCSSGPKNTDTKVDWKNIDILEKHGTWIESNVREIRENLSKEELYDLMNFHDVLVYPSSGEGFGMIPLEAIATGMPVITTTDWCSYKQYVHEDGVIFADFIDVADSIPSIFNHYSPYYKDGEYMGQILKPSVDSMIECLIKVSENIDEQCKFYYNQCAAVVNDFNWESSVKARIDGLYQRAYNYMIDPK